MLRSIFSLFKKSTSVDKATEENSLYLEKLLKEVEGKEEMQMLLKDYRTRNKMDKGGGTSSSPVSSS